MSRSCSATPKALLHEYMKKAGGQLTSTFESSQAAGPFNCTVVLNGGYVDGHPLPEALHHGTGKTSSEPGWA